MEDAAYFMLSCRLTGCRLDKTYEIWRRDTRERPGRIPGRFTKTKAPFATSKLWCKLHSQQSFGEKMQGTGDLARAAAHLNAVPTLHPIDSEHSERAS